MSVASGRSGRFGGGATNGGGSGGSGRGSVLGPGAAVALGKERERMRRDYEYKIATMQSKVAGLEWDLGGKGEREQKRVEGEERVRLWRRNSLV